MKTGFGFKPSSNLPPGDYPQDPLGDEDLDYIDDGGDPTEFDAVTVTTTDEESVDMQEIFAEQLFRERAELAVDLLQKVVTPRDEIDGDPDRKHIRKLRKQAIALLSRYLESI